MSEGKRPLAGSSIGGQGIGTIALWSTSVVEEIQIDLLFDVVLFP
ncbi:MAG: hypothetical protein ACJASV_002095 [Pseudorhodobacter sp.]|jgi:hypothetical protein